MLRYQCFEKIQILPIPPTPKPTPTSVLYMFFRYNNLGRRNPARDSFVLASTNPIKSHRDFEKKKRSII